MTAEDDKKSEVSPQTDSTENIVDSDNENRPERYNATVVSAPINDSDTETKDPMYGTTDQRNNAMQQQQQDSSIIPVVTPEDTHEANKMDQQLGSKKIVPVPQPVNNKDTDIDNTYDDTLLTPSKKTEKTRTVQIKYTHRIPQSLKKKLADIRVLVIDVDGVMTDGSIYITDQGTGFKCFNSQDGHGLKMLIQNDIDIVLLSARRCKATRKRARELGIGNINTGIDNKKSFVLDYMQSNKLLPKEIAYVGDDLIDLPAMMECGTKIMPANGISVMAKAMDYTTKAHGGHGAVREVCDMILIAKDLYQQYIDY